MTGPANNTPSHRELFQEPKRMAKHTFFNLIHAPQSGLIMSHALRLCRQVRHPDRVRVTFLLFLLTLSDGVSFLSRLGRSELPFIVDMMINIPTELPEAANDNSVSTILSVAVLLCAYQNRAFLRMYRTSLRLIGDRP